MAAAITELQIADDPAIWADLGFTVEGDRCRVGTVDLILTGSDSGNGITGWTWHGSPDAGFGTIETAFADQPPGDAASEHPNTAAAMFYVVLMGPSHPDLVSALETVGTTVSEPTTMGRSDAAMLRSLAPAGGIEVEVIAPATADPDRSWELWGVIIEVADIDALATRLRSRLKSVKPAMQPGRRIATLDRSAGSSVPIAFMTAIEP